MSENTFDTINIPSDSPSTPLTYPPNPVSHSYLTQNRTTNLHICSLNCRSLAKPANLDLSRSFSRFLTSSDLDILCLQETYTSDPDVQNRLDIQLKSKTSIWTHYCGVVSLNPAIQLDDAFVSTNGRLIICTVSHVSNLFPSFRLMNIYAPASPFARYDFYADLLQLPYFRTLLSQLPTQSFSFPTDAPTMIVGDFNYNFRHFPSSSIRTTIHDPNFLTNLHLNFPSPPEPAPPTLDGSFPLPTLDSNDPSNLPPQSRAQWLWHAMLQHYYQECSHRLQTDPLIPTFTNNQYRSTIDYMYIAPPLTDFLHTSQVEFIGSQWTDHAMLSLHFKIRNNNHGKGLWRANPRLATNSFFINLLHNYLDEFHQNLSQTTLQPSPQLIWDDIKNLTRSLAQRVSRKQAEWRRRQLKHLQRKRNRILRNRKSTAVLNDRLPGIEKAISSLQQEIVEHQALRSGLHWRENGETSAGFLKRLVTQREYQRTLPTLKDPATGASYTSQVEKEQAVHSFYSHLYTPEIVNPNDIQFFTNMIPPSHRLSDESHASLCAPFTIDDILDGLSRRAPNHSSPGPDSPSPIPDRATLVLSPCYGCYWSPCLQ